MTMTMPPPMPDAACAEVDPDIFYPTHGGNGSDSAAKAVCRGCPELVACRAWAIPREPYGIWGGLTADERGRYRRARGIALVTRVSLGPESVVERGVRDRTAPARGRKSALADARRDKAREFAEAGLTARETAAAMGLPLRTVQGYRTAVAA